MSGVHSHERDGVAGVTSWYPIDKAPRDGTWVLIIGINSVGAFMYPAVAYWHKDAKCWTAVDPAVIPRIGIYGEEHPTHWMPLPAPPRSVAPTNPLPDPPPPARGHYFLEAIRAKEEVRLGRNRHGGPIPVGSDRPKAAT